MHLKFDFDWTTKPLYDVIATIPGLRLIRISGSCTAIITMPGSTAPAIRSAAPLRLARNRSRAGRTGANKAGTPKRTIILAFWDGEEFGLVGSTEWAEKHADELDRKLAVYINSDSNGRER